MRHFAERIAFRVTFCLYAVAVGFYFVRYNNGLDPGIPGYLAALRLEWFGEADPGFTIRATMSVALVPFLIVAAVVRKFAPRNLEQRGTSCGCPVLCAGSSSETRRQALPARTQRLSRRQASNVMPPPALAAAGRFADQRGRCWRVWFTCSGSGGKAA